MDIMTGKEPWYGDKAMLIALVTGAISTIITSLNIIITLARK